MRWLNGPALCAGDYKGFRRVSEANARGKDVHRKIRKGKMTHDFLLKNITGFRGVH